MNRVRATNDRLPAVLGTLADLEGLLDDAADEVIEALHVHASTVMDLLEAPLVLTVDVEHWRAAVALVTAFIDGELFAAELGAECAASAADVQRRCAVLYALVQLTADAIAESAAETELDPLNVLSRLAIRRGHHAG